MEPARGGRRMTQTSHAPRCRTGRPRASSSSQGRDRGRHRQRRRQARRERARAGRARRRVHARHCAGRARAATPRARPAARRPRPRDDQGPVRRRGRLLAARRHHRQRRRCRRTRGALPLHPPPAHRRRARAARRGRPRPPGAEAAVQRPSEVRKLPGQGLVWPRRAAPRRLATALVPATRNSYNWSGAKAYCGGVVLAGGGWRVPSVKELMTLVDFSVASPGPTIDTTAFPNTPADVFLVLVAAGWPASRPTPGPSTSAAATRAASA